MNYLAHTFLSCSDVNMLIGNLLSDMLKPKEQKEMAEKFQQGLQLHRLIDSFTDHHPAVKRSTKRLHPIVGKYAPVVVDVYYDFVLFQNWNSLTSEDFKAFTTNIYDIIYSVERDLPPQWYQRLKRMADHDWLHVYTSEEGIQDVLSRVSKKARFDNKIGNALEYIKPDYDLYNEDFNEFFPVLQKEVAAFCGC